jgi:hypothetical protein
VGTIHTRVSPSTAMCSKDRWILCTIHAGDQVAAVDSARPAVATLTVSPPPP